MKKIIQFLIVSLFSLAVLSTTAYADAFKGGRIFNNAIVKGCPMLTADLAGTHSRKEWKQIVNDGKLIEVIHQICPKAVVEPIPENEMKDVLDYLQYYSRDGGALPSC